METIKDIAFLLALVAVVTLGGAYMYQVGNNDLLIEIAYDVRFIKQEIVNRESCK